MCLLGIAFQSYESCPVLVLANREESFSRPTASPRIQPPQGGIPAWLGGTDLLAGGTWLGINAQGLLAAVTNRRQQNVPATLRSRGRLCRSLLAFRSTEAAVRSAVEQLRQDQFAGCNLLIATRAEAAAIEFGDGLRVTSLSPGLHLMTNADLNDANDNRIARVRQEFTTATPGNPTDWIARARHVCALGPQAEQPAICLVGGNRGTVSSTVLALADRLDDSQYWYAEGPPAEVAYDDRSPLLHTLLSAPGTTAKSHRIQLRGPWRFEPLARAVRDTRPENFWSQEALPAPGTIRLPATWRQLFGDFRGRVSFRRRFHRPNNLEPHERVFVILEDVAGTGVVTVNGRHLGPMAADTQSFCADVTDLLTGNDELRIDLELTDQALEPAAAPLWKTAALEIRIAEADRSRGPR